MYWNYLKTAARSIFRQKTYSAINILGLAVGMASCILIMLWVQDELSYDRFHDKARYLHRVVMTVKEPSGQFDMAVTPVPLSDALLDEYPSVVNACRFYPGGNKMVKWGESRFDDNVVAYADAELLEMFSLPLMVETGEAVLSDPSSIIITEEMRRKCFGQANPLGKMLTIDSRDFRVSAVLKNIPRNSHLQFECLLPMSASRWGSGYEDNWGVCGLYTYVQLADNASATDVNREIAEVRGKHLPRTQSTLSLQPVTRIHLHHKYEDSLEGHGDIRYVYLFTVMAVFLLLIACINFMNLATARSAVRAKEVGTRKVVGATRWNLIGQFYVESVAMSILALCFALLAVELSLPFFSAWAGKPLTLSGSGTIVLILAGVTLTTGIVAGSYPAGYLSSFRPAVVIRGITVAERSRGLFRRTLVVLQFALAITAIVGTSVISAQLNFMSNRNPGYNPENLVFVRISGELAERFETMRHEILRSPDVVGVSGGSMPIEAKTSTIRWDWSGKPPNLEVSVHPMFVDREYIETLQLTMVAGRTFSTDQGADVQDKYIVNESAVQVMGLEEPIGARMGYSGHYGSNREGEIIGVVKDFHYGSLHNEIGPVVMLVNHQAFRYLCARIQPDGASAAIDHMRNVWNEYAPDRLFRYWFLDATVTNLYRGEQRLVTVFSLFTSLSVLISCLGLVGMISFAVERRTREVGIRKAFGASVTAVIRLLTREVALLVLMANIVSWPIAYFMANRWLQGFAYKIECGWSTLALAGAAAMLVALSTVSLQTFRAACTNPAKALRHE